MELVQVNSEDTLMGLQIGNSKEFLGRFVDAQRELFHSQVDQLQRIVVTQCKLTGVNPLSQEMAAGALSIKIGKRPRDLLNPKAIKYMQSIFSIKDIISKKEIREISALCGVTVSQVREFFAGQRSRVRKLVRLSREKVIKCNASNAISNGHYSTSNHVTPISEQTSENTVNHMNVEECIQVPVNSMQQLNSVEQSNQASKESAEINTVTDSLACSLQEETIAGIDSDDRNFLENIFSLMRKEETFSGQVKLMEWILQIRNTAILHWFLTKGGVMTLATWLSQAALEEQTTVLLVVFKVLCHLPLHKALPAQMSAILQTVNKLRFYKTAEISNKARVLLSRWSKMFVRSQALKRPFSMNCSTHKESIQKQRVNENVSNESWLSKVDLPEDVLALGYEGSDYSWELESKSALKLLPATCNDSSKKQTQSVSCSKTKERRKVLLMEQPDHKIAGRNIQPARAVPAKNSRPISADDIQKAKMRAIFMQRKYGKPVTPAIENGYQQTITQKISIASKANNILSMSKLPKLERDEDKKSVVCATEASEAMLNMLVDTKLTLTSVNLKPSLDSFDSKPCLISQESSSKKLKNGRVTWQTPPVMRMNSIWTVGAGENSKEMEVQTARIRREEETFYSTAGDIPANPKDPWDMEMDFDDSLTPEVPTETPPDADSTDAVDGEPSTNPEVDKDNAEEDRPPAATTSAPATAAGASEPDLELLAVLLKNPELVFALTSGQGSSLSNAETVALLDVLKNGSGGLTGLLNGLAGTTSQSPEPTSLPSPTPPSERTGAGWRVEPASVVTIPPLLQQQQHHLPGIGAVAILPAMAAPPDLSPSPLSLPGAVAVPAVVLPPAPTGTLPTNPNPSPARLPTQLPPATSLPLPHNVRPPVPLVQHVPKPERVPPSERPSVNTGAPHLVRREAVNSEQMHNLMPPPVTTRSSVQPLLQTLPPLMTTMPLPEPPARSPLPPRWPPGAASGSREPAPHSWHGRASGVPEAPVPNSRFTNDQSDVNILAAGSGRTRSVLPGRMAEANDLLDRSELEPWSPERSPSTGSEYPSARGFPDARRSGDYVRSDRSERSRYNHHHQHHQHSGGHRDRYRSGRRWRDRDRRL